MQPCALVTPLGRVRVPVMRNVYGDFVSRLGVAFELSLPFLRTGCRRRRRRRRKMPEAAAAVSRPAQRHR